MHAYVQVWKMQTIFYCQKKEKVKKLCAQGACTEVYSIMTSSLPLKGRLQNTQEDKSAW